MKKVFMVAMFAALGASSVSALAETPVDEASDELAAAHDDRRFLLDFANSNLLAVNSARAAVHRIRNVKIAVLALQELAEHVNITEGNEALAQKFGVEVPTELDALSQVLLQRLLDLPQGNRFDRAYLHIVIESHRLQVELLLDALLSEDAEVKAFAERNLPILRAHLQAAQELLQSQPVE